jgi:hypothetical protein
MQEYVARWPRSLKMQAKQAGTRRGWISVHCGTLQRHEIMAKALGFATRRSCSLR